MRALKIQLFLFAILLIVVSGCNGISSGKSKKSDKYGGTLRVNATSEPDMVFPGQVSKSSEHLIINQAYDGLVKYHPRTFDVVPSLASRWLSERNGTIYTFYIRSNAYFHKDKCFKNKEDRRINAAAVKSSLEQIAKTYRMLNQEIPDQVLNIVGAEEIMNDNLPYDSISIKGIEVFDDSTLIFYLKEADDLFLHYLAGTNALVFSKKAFDKYGFKSTVGSGAFTYEYFNKASDRLVMLANKEYYRTNKQGEQLPFLDSIIVSFVTSTSKEVELLANNEIDMLLGLPEKYVTPFLDENIELFQNNPPHFLLKQNPEFENRREYNILRSNIHGFELNSQNFYDFSETYRKDPEPEEVLTAN